MTIHTNPSGRNTKNKKKKSKIEGLEKIFLGNLDLEKTHFS
jgi:hypothetical protein